MGLYRLLITRTCQRDVKLKDISSPSSIKPCIVGTTIHGWSKNKQKVTNYMGEIYVRVT